MKLLFAEDTEDLNHVVSTLLTREGFCVDAFTDGESALNAALQNGYDGMILDIMMPGRDGISVLKELRRRGIRTPVLLLTAKAEVDDRVAGLDAGADDYLPKPFAMKELLARVRAMTRRNSAYAQELLNYEDFTLDISTLTLKAENSLRLSLKEAGILRELMKSGAVPVREELLISQFWRNEEQARAETLRLYVNFLRRKLSSVASMITVRSDGSGYFLGKADE